MLDNQPGSTITTPEFKVFVPEYIKGQKGLKVFAIYPDYWNKNWGPAPLLGFVAETDSYWAKYAAYTGKLLPYNATFGPKPILLKKRNKKQ